jgi:hypothetical protein
MAELHALKPRAERISVVFGHRHGGGGSCYADPPPQSGHPLGEDRDPIRSETVPASSHVRTPTANALLA